MKVTAIFLLAGALTTSAAGLTQTVTLDLKNVPVQRVFKEVIRQTGISIVYKESMFEDAPKVSIKVTNAKVEDVLQQCLQGLAFEALVEGNSVVVKKRQGPSLPPVARDDNQMPQPPPQIDVRGRVVNENGEGVVATVTVKGTKNAVSTDENGFFVIKGVDENAVLVITATNIETREVRSLATLGMTGGFANAGDVVVKMKVGQMEEVIVNKGYYTEKMRNTVGNVATVGAKDIEKSPVQNVLLAIQGKVTGMEITQLSGLNGGGVQVQIQGRNSIHSGLNPLVIIDGVPFGNQLTNTGDAFPLENMLRGGSPLNYINPNDIESISILKDADATSLYGSRAANGAILIRTKKRKSRKK